MKAVGPLRTVTWSVQRAGTTNMWGYLEGHWDDNNALEDSFIDVWASQERTIHYHTASAEVQNGQLRRHTWSHGDIPHKGAIAISTDGHNRVQTIGKRSLQNAVSFAGTKKNEHYIIRAKPNADCYDRRPTISRGISAR